MALSGYMVFQKNQNWIWISMTFWKARAYHRQNKSKVSSNFAQNDSKWAQIIISSHILSHFSQNVDQKWKTVKSEVGSNFSQNDSKWALIIISSHILSHFSQKVDQKWKTVKSEDGSNFAQNDSIWSLIIISGKIVP